MSAFRAAMTTTIEAEAWLDIRGAFVDLATAYVAARQAALNIKGRMCEDLPLSRTRRFDEASARYWRER